jgi:hypothetical protein
MTEIIRLPALASTGTDERARANTERNRRLFDWALEVLKQLGLDQAVAQAKSIGELAGVTLDLESAAIVLAIRDALHPASGRRQPHFEGLRAGGLKQIIKNRFTDLKKDREEILRRRAGRTGSDWETDLELDDDGKIKPILSNLILILCNAPKWAGVLAYDEFGARVVIRKQPPWGAEPIEAPWTDHHDTQTRVWFQHKAKINPAIGDLGRAVQAAARRKACSCSFAEAQPWKPFTCPAAPSRRMTDMDRCILRLRFSQKCCGNGKNGCDIVASPSKAGPIGHAADIASISVIPMGT